MTTTRPLFSVYDDGTIEGRISPVSFSLAAQPQHRATLQAPRVLEETSEFLKLHYRALSQALVWQEGFFGMVVTDFSKEGVLKPSAPLLKDVTVMSDHRFSAAEYIGIVDDAFWTDDINGVPVSGIDAIYKLDKKPQLPPEHPHRIVVRGVEQGYIKGSSVRVWFDYEKSHPTLDDWSFYEAMGTEVDGQIVRFIATHIRRYLETSIVIAGADPLAQPADTLEDDTRADLAASFSSAGWSLPDRKAMVSLSDNPEHKEKPPMPRKKTQAMDAEDQAVDDVVDAPEEGKDTPVEDSQETLKQDTPDSDDTIDAPADRASDDAPDEAPETELTEETQDVENVSTSAVTPELNAAIKDAVAQALQTQREAFDQEKADLEATHAAQMQAKDRRHQVEIFYTDLQAGHLPASFDELNVVDGLLTLSQEPTITLGTGDTVSQQTWAQMLLAEAAKFARVPTEPLAPDAKEPTREDNAKLKAKREALAKDKQQGNPKLSDTDALKLVATEHPELFPTNQGA
jgi:hypothetical protein